MALNHKMLALCRAASGNITLLALAFILIDDPTRMRVRQAERRTIKRQSKTTRIKRVAALRAGSEGLINGWFYSTKQGFRPTKTN